MLAVQHRKEFEVGINFTVRVGKREKSWKEEGSRGKEARLGTATWESKGDGHGEDGQASRRSGAKWCRIDGWADMFVFLRRPVSMRV